MPALRWEPCELPPATLEMLRNRLCDDLAPQFIALRTSARDRHVTQRVGDVPLQFVHMRTIRERRSDVEPEKDA